MQRFEQLKDDLLGLNHKMKGQSQRPQITPKKQNPSFVTVDNSLATHRKSENFVAKNG